MKVFIFSALVLVSALGMSQAAEAVSSQSKKRAQAMLESIKRTLMSEKGAAARNFIKNQDSENDDASLLMQENGDDDKLLMQLEDGLLKGQFTSDGVGMAKVPGLPKGAAAAEGLTDDDSNASIQWHYVRIPYYMWQRVWVYYYYLYYRNYALHFIRG